MKYNLKVMECSGPEFLPVNHRTRKAYHKLIDIRNNFNIGNITAFEFISKIEIVVFNDIPTNDLKYLRDGGAGPYYTIIKELIRSLEGGNLYRLKSDLLTVY